MINVRYNKMSKTLIDLKKDYNKKLELANKQLKWLEDNKKHPKIEEYIKLVQITLKELNDLIIYIETCNKIKMTAEQILTGFKESELILP